LLKLGAASAAALAVAGGTLALLQPRLHGLHAGALSAAGRQVFSGAARALLDFPTSIGANPQLSVYGIANRLAQALAKRLSGRDVILA
jgi:hypothetical protein